MKTPKRKITTLKQIRKLIPGHLVDKLAAQYKIDVRKFSPWSHIVSLLHAQLAHSLSLNDICDALANHASALSDIRGATPPKRNTLSNANRTCDAGTAEALFRGVYDELRRLAPNFGMGRGYSGLPRRFKRTINAIDSTTIQLFANCLDWAKHRRRKAAAKMHLCLNLQTFLPRFVVADSAKGHDSTKAMSLCFVLKAGEIAIFDKAYIKFDFLSDLTERGVFWGGRAKDNMDYVTMGQHPVRHGWSRGRTVPGRWRFRELRRETPKDQSCRERGEIRTVDIHPGHVFELKSHGLTHGIQALWDDTESLLYLDDST